MAANEFEKNVKRAMGEFRIHPSDEVWEKVERRIKENKRKRRIIFFILFSFIGVALGGYGIYNFSDGRKLTSEIRDKKAKEIMNNEQGARNNEHGIMNNEHGTRNKEQGTRNKEQGSEMNKKQENKLESNGTKSQVNASQSVAVNVKGPGNQNASRKNQIKKISKSAPPDNNHSNLVKKRLNEPVPATDDKAKETSRDRLVTKNMENNIADQPKVSAHIDGNIVGVPSHDTISSKIEDKDHHQMVSVKNKKNRNANLRKFQWGLNFTAGISTLTQDVLSFKGTLDAGSNTSSVPGGATGGGGTFTYSPSSNKPGFAFKAGVNVRENISLRSSISAGLNYSHQGDRIKIGAPQNGGQQSGSSSGRTYYRASQQNTFIDHFDFLELPVLFNWHLTKNPNRSFSLSGGAAATYLVSTNALVFDTTLSGIYYHDKSLFRRAHVSILSGISYHASNKRNLDLSVGPQFSFDLTRLIKSDVDKRQYLLYGGIDARVYFQKKKK